jgi:hypothetical protein
MANVVNKITRLLARILAIYMIIQPIIPAS